MERMKLDRKNKNLKEELDIERRGHLQSARRVKQLEEENKKLKEKIELLDNENMCLNAEIKDREEENKELKEERQALIRTLDSLGYGERTY